MKNDFILYDGDCYFCNSYIAYSKIKKKYKGIKIINIRDCNDEYYLKIIKIKRIDINKGMLMHINGIFYYGHRVFKIINDMIYEDNSNLIIKYAWRIISSNDHLIFLTYNMAVKLRNLYLLFTLKKQIRI
ncbi:hypothetical protein TUMSATVNIG1_28670 [Vibrio nigripulchritudo]|uniref:DCC1-like thiol-disulfide oxidoreductase family protein n=1 Tax=Vibrio nigripulchritudo TaxID=28173 RepID=UPI00190AAACA|nr:hypothetical protein VNTUMSATTG_28390 [Vibrio nigripulchritudo]BDU32258.1 hypothetical protein TUMSATVNIG1_28670 [Vibrio nigripulchritudo]